MGMEHHVLEAAITFREPHSFTNSSPDCNSANLHPQTVSEVMPKILNFVGSNRSGWL